MHAPCSSNSASTITRHLLVRGHVQGVEELGVFYLGESFLCPWLPEAIRFAKQDVGFP